ncbi:hypothetical protein CBM2595_A30552 [Cupriavidus taiwanensis]|uniref:Uncharacterized protein n=1 Tax=Cupriavidus taiwanensis TaxID=164546 RepID=A0A7Z7NKF4_9BURK|nr:hypothetical protein CBM2595_A30552 [Cupriavidus taiwanensis]SPC09223.1 hypothetical protein CBM2594_A40546 [Cupriavidus taiwanensis]
MHAPQRGARAVAQAARGGVHAGRDLAQSGIDGLQRHPQEAHQQRIDQRGDAAGQQQPRRHPELLLQPGRQRIVQPRHGDQHAHRDDRARQRIAHAAHPGQAAHQPAALAVDRARGVAHRQRNRHRGERGDAGQQEAVAHQADEARAELRVAIGEGHATQHQRGDQETQQHRHQARRQRQPAAGAVEGPGRGAALVAEHLRAAAAGALHQQDGGDEQQHAGRQLRRGVLVAQREPGAVDAGGEGRDGEIGHRAEISQRFHHRQRGAGDDAGARQRQYHAPEPAPGAVAEQARGLQRILGLLQEGGARGQVNVRVQHQREQRDGAAQRADLRKPVVARAPAGQLAQPALHRAGELQRVGVGVGNHIGRHRHRQHQRPFHHGMAREAVGRYQPGGGHAQQQHAGSDAAQQPQGIEHVLGQHRVDQVAPGIAGGQQHGGRNHQHRHGDQQRHRHGGQGQGVEMAAAGQKHAGTVSKVPPAEPEPGGAVCGLTHSSNAGAVGAPRGGRTRAAGTPHVPIMRTCEPIPIHDCPAPRPAAVRPPVPMPRVPLSPPRPSSRWIVSATPSAATPWSRACRSRWRAAMSPAC